MLMTIERHKTYSIRTQNVTPSGTYSPYLPLNKSPKLILNTQWHTKLTTATIRLPLVHKSMSASMKRNDGDWLKLGPLCAPPRPPKTIARLPWFVNQIFHNISPIYIGIWLQIDFSRSTWCGAGLLSATFSWTNHIRNESLLSWALLSVAVVVVCCWQQ